jgi:hypothetical protein
MSSSSISSLLVCLALILGAAPARAQSEAEQKEHARELAREGAELFKDGNRRAAVVKFEEAYAAYPSPALLYNLGKAYAGLSDDVKAHRALTRFLRESAADDFDEMRRAEVEALLADVATRVAVTTITAPKFAGATLEVDGEAIGAAPLPDPIAVAPGVHELTARRGKALVARKRVSLQAGAVAVELVRIEDDLEKVFITREVDRARPIYKKWWFWTAIGAAAVSTVTAIIVTNPRVVNDVDDPPLGSFDLEDFGQ